MPLMHTQSNRAQTAIRVSARHAPFLSCEFEVARDGRLDDLARHRDQLADPRRTRAQVEFYDGLLKQLAIADVLTGDPEQLRAVLTDLAIASDGGNDYERAVAEHEAFHHLLDQLNGGGR
jgi:hypothetical protein